MSGPILIKAREKQCTGAGPCIPRQLTEEERIKYGIKKMEGNEVKEVKIIPPEREKLIGTLAEVTGKTKARHYAAKIFSVSVTTIDRWIKGYGIEFDAEGYVVRDRGEEVPPKEEASEVKQFDEEVQELSEVKIPEPIVDDAGDIEKLLEELENNPIGTIHIVGQETTKKHYKVGYAEYDIGNAFVQVDFRKEIVDFSPGMSFEETEAAIELLSEIL